MQSAARRPHDRDGSGVSPFGGALHLRFRKQAFACPESRYLTVLSPSRRLLESHTATFYSVTIRTVSYAPVPYVLPEFPLVSDQARCAPFRTRCRAHVGVSPRPSSLDNPALGGNPRTVVLLFTLAAHR